MSVISICKEEVVMLCTLPLHLLSHFLLRQGLCYLCVPHICILPAVWITVQHPENLLPVCDVRQVSILQSDTVCSITFHNRGLPQKHTYYLYRQRLFSLLSICMLILMLSVLLLVQISVWGVVLLSVPHVVLLQYILLF